MSVCFKVLAAIFHTFSMAINPGTVDFFISVSVILLNGRSRSKFQFFSRLRPATSALEQHWSPKAQGQGYRGDAAISCIQKSLWSGVVFNAVSWSMSWWNIKFSMSTSSRFILSVHVRCLCTTWKLGVISISDISLMENYQ